jgi:hypothetical protein
MLYVKPHTFSKRLQHIYIAVGLTTRSTGHMQYIYITVGRRLAPAQFMPQYTFLQIKIYYNTYIC